MRYGRILAAGLVSANLCCAPAPAAQGDDLLARAAALNPGLRSFTATLHAHVAMKSFPYLSADVSGNWYYQQPDRYKVVFTSGMPVIAQQFDKLYVRLEPPAQWRQRNAVTFVSDDGKATHYRLVPRKPGNVESIDAAIDDKSATVTSMRWNYANGAYAEVRNRYSLVAGNELVESQTGHVEEPGYTGDISSTVSDYRVNAPIPQGIFSQ